MDRATKGANNLTKPVQTTCLNAVFQLSDSGMTKSLTDRIVLDLLSIINFSYVKGYLLSG